jgi:hypothetical protein
MRKTTIKIDSQVLEPWRDIAWILGMTLSDFLEGYLRQLGCDLRGLDNIGEEISDWYQTREEAQAVADRFEAFAIERKLSGDPVGTVAAEVVAVDDKYTVKAHYLSPAGKRWRSSSVIGDWNGTNDDDQESAP